MRNIPNTEALAIVTIPSPTNGIGTIAWATDKRGLAFRLHRKTVEAERIAPAQRICGNAMLKLSGPETRRNHSWTGELPVDPSVWNVTTMDMRAVVS